MTTVSDIRNKRIATFVRGYFGWLEKQGFEVAILHQWESKFEKNISDIDYVIEPRGFHQLLDIVSVYCREQGWQLCQVLRHENTAAFCVCSASDDPSCVVALDACTDYQRHGFLLLRYKDLLNGREVLPWGGYRLAPPIEMRYRFIKAAAKAKPPGKIIPALLEMPVQAREGLPEWLQERWNIEWQDWSFEKISKVLLKMTHHLQNSRISLSITTMRRLLRRIIHPDGLMVIVDNTEGETANLLHDIFSRLYFRNCKYKKKASLHDVSALICSTLVITEKATLLLKLILPGDSILNLKNTTTNKAIAHEVIKHLKNRLMKRSCLRVD